MGKIRFSTSSRSMVHRAAAVFSAAIMLLVTFQVMAYDARAATQESSPPAPEESIPLATEGYIANSTDSQAPPIIASDANVPIESVNEGVNITLSSMGETSPENYMTNEGQDLCFWTANGTYIANASRPWSVALLSFNGTELVRESYFTVQVGMQMLRVSDIVDIGINDHELSVSYLLSDAITEKVTAGMCVTYAFHEGKSPKITASVVDILEDIGPWQVVWIVVPNRDAKLYDASIGKEGALLRSLPGTDFSPSSPAVNMGVDEERMLVDWSDAKSGQLNVALCDSDDIFEGAQLEVAFSEGQKTIDPTFICTVTDTNPTGICSQRKTLWNDGYYWLFYNSGTGICYRNSPDGITWSAAISLPEGTAPASSSGFDVASRNGYVMVGWRDSSNVVSAKRGTIFGDKIIWTAKVTLYSGASQQPVSVAIGYDNLFWIGYVRGSPMNLYIFKSLTTGDSFTEVMHTGAFDTNAPANCLWTVLLPYEGGNLIVLEASYSSGGANNPNIRYRYYYGAIGGWWSSEATYNIGMYNGISPDFKSNTFSAVASPNGTLHIVCRSNDIVDGRIHYAYIYPGGVKGWYAPVPVWCYENPTICLDANGVLHVFAVASETVRSIVHMEKAEYGGSWSYEEAMYACSESEYVRGLTSCILPVNKCSIAWGKELSGTKTLAFASTPLPFGTSGYSYEAWNRDGLSPYGTYFAANGMSVAPGSGQATVVQEGVSIESRGGLELGVSLVYQQPKYIRYNGLLDHYKEFPFSNLGSYWSLDLPWMSSFYLYLGGGQSYVIRWGNEGNVSEFVNHAGAHFVLRDIKKGATNYYELFLASGFKYRFNHDAPYRLEMISDLRNYNPANTVSTVPYNCLNLTYTGASPNFVLQSITESGMGRSITFTYSGGYLSKIYRPDGKSVNLTYSSSKLASVADARGRLTQFNYTAGCDGLLDWIQFPTGGKVVLNYARDSTPATDTRSWLVTKETLYNGTSTIRRTDFSYKVVNGNIIFSSLANYDESGTLQGTTGYSFLSSRRSMVQTIRNADGQQMSAVCTTYDAVGQPVRFDRYMGDPATANGWYSSVWGWRKAHTIAGTTDGAQTNYQMKLTVYYGAGTDSGSSVYCGGNCKADFSDLRFTSSDGVTLLDHWIESYTASTSAVVWVEVPSIPASPGTASIYMYYGNAAASSGSSGDATFLFFDDFPGTSLDANKWGVVGQSIAYTVANSKLSVTDKGGADWGQSCIGFRAKQGGGIYNPPDDSFAMEAIGLTWNGAQSSMTMWGPTLSDATTDKCFVRFYDAWAYQYGAKSSNIDATFYSSGYGTLAASGTARTLTTKDASNNVRHYWDGGLIQGPLADATDYSQLFVHVEKYSTYGIGTLTLDSVFLRKFTATAPTSVSWGSAVSFAGTTEYTGTIEYASYDDWGNRVFTRDALGNEAYTSFANTSTQNSFQGEDKLTKTTEGRIFADSFDDWSYSDWTPALDRGVAELNISADAPRAPSVKITRTSSSPGSAQLTHGISPGTSSFWVQCKFRTSTLIESWIILTSSGNARIYLSFSNGAISCYIGSTYYQVASYATNTWYNIGFYVNRYNNTYNVHVDNVMVKCGASLQGTEVLNTIRMQAGWSGSGVTSIWFDNVFMCKDDRAIITGLGSTGYVAELYSYDNVLLDRGMADGALYFNGAWPVFSGHIKLWKIGYTSSATIIHDVWPGDVYTLAPRFSSSNLKKSTTGFKESSASVADDSYPGTASTYNYNGGGWYVYAPDYSVSGSYYMQGAYGDSNNYPLSVVFGFYSTTYNYLPITSTQMLTQYVWLESGKVPKEIMLQYRVDGIWKRVFWSSMATDYIDATSLPPSSTKRIDSLPTTTGKWLQLTVKGSDIGAGASSQISGILYGTYGGSARWDYSSTNAIGIVFNGLSSGITVKMRTTNGTVMSQTASSSSPMTMDVYSKLRVFPLEATFEFLDGAGKQLYLSPKLSEVFNHDTYQYSVPKFYANQIKDTIHNRPVGAFQYQNTANTSAMESYVKYDFEGNAIESKSNASGSWVCSRASYDLYGNLLWSSDPTGRKSILEYSASNKNTYPVSSLEGDRTEFFDFETTWSTSTSSYWLTAAYSTAYSYSPTKSAGISFNGAPLSIGTGNAMFYKDFQTNSVKKISVRILCPSNSYYHNGDAGEYMDSGVRMRLYNSAGSNYATYTYWLACWSGSSNNRTGDSLNKVIYGRPTADVWLNPVLYPDSDFSGIDWSQCNKVRFELYTNVYEAYNGDYLHLYFDDLTFNDLTTAKTIYSYDVKNGRAISVTDPLNHVTGYWYDAVGRIKQVNNTDGTNTEIVYNDGARTTTVFDELDRKTVSTYDPIGREVKVERYGKGSTVYSSVSFTYNWQDQVRTAKDELLRMTTYSYDYLGRLVSTTNPDSTQSTVSYNDRARIVTATDEAGHRTAWVYDNLGRLNSTREYWSSSQYNETLMTYDRAGDLLTVKAATIRGGVTRMSYDTLGRLTSTLYPDGKLESATYDEAGRVLTMTPRKGSSYMTTYAYDTAGNTIRIIGQSDTIRIKYDAEGRVTEKKNSLGSISYQYNGREQVSQLTEVIDSNSYTFSFLYNQTGTLNRTVYPTGTRVYYDYDSFDRLVRVRDNSTNLITYTYNKDDSLSSKTYGSNKAMVQYEYKPSTGQLSKIRASYQGTVFMNLNYNYTADGNVADIKNTTVTPYREEYFSYDELGRLTSAVASNTYGTISYAYDQMGNRVSKVEQGVTTSYSYTTYNKLAQNTTSGSTWSYLYDDNGNIVTKSRTTPTAITWDYTYDSFDQLIQVKKNSADQGQYWYDANGARAKTLVGGVTERSVYVGHDPIYSVSTSDGKPNKYVYAGGWLELRLVSSGEWYAYICDALGSVRFVLKNGEKTVANTVYWASTYKPFGGAIGASGSDRKFTYAGEIQDATGLVYLGVRYYEPELGRFVSLDPVLGSPVAPQTLNRFTYCLNNPELYTDPNGNTPTIVTALIGAGLGALIGGVSAWLTGGNVWAGVIGGAAGGFLAGLTCGASLAVSILIGGGVGGAIDSGITTYAEAGDVGQSLQWAGIGGAIGIVTCGKGGSVAKRALVREITPILDDVASKAVRRAGMEGLTMGQQKALDRLSKLGLHGIAGRLEKAFWGERVDYWFREELKDAMKKNPLLGDHLLITPRGRFGPDVVLKGDFGQFWWDLTTVKSWPKHFGSPQFYCMTHGPAGKMIGYTLNGAR